MWKSSQQETSPSGWLDLVLQVWRMWVKKKLGQLFGELGTIANIFKWSGHNKSKVKQSIYIATSDNQIEELIEEYMDEW